MFLSILNLMLKSTPGLLRPAVNWLLDGLRRLTTHISGRWNVLGAAAGVMYSGIVSLRTQMGHYAMIVAAGLTWVRDVYVPRKLTEGIDWASRVITATVMAVRAELRQLIDGAIALVRAGVGRLDALMDSVIRWAQRELADLLADARQLRAALAHVLAGPAHLAEWLIGHLWGAAWRYVQAQRDRIVNWALNGSLAATRWLAREIEDIIVRLL